TPPPLPRLLQKQKRKLKDPRVGQLELLFERIVFKYVDGGYPAECSEEMLFGIRIIDRPPRLNDSMRSRAAIRLVFDAGHFEFTAGVILIGTSGFGRRRPPHRNPAEKKNDQHRNCTLEHVWEILRFEELPVNDEHGLKPTFIYFVGLPARSLTSF